MSIYRVTHRESGRAYIGLSKNPRVRWKSHRWHAAHGSKGKFHLTLAKYGPESFDWEVVAELPSLPEAQIAERILIAVEQPELNLSAGGDGNWGYVPTAETRAKIGAAHRGMKRPPRSPEWRAAQGAARRGKKWTEDQKAEIRQRMRTPEMRALAGSGWRGKSNPAQSLRMKGRKLTPEHKAKIAEGVRAARAQKKQESS